MINYTVNKDTDKYNEAYNNYLKRLGPYFFFVAFAGFCLFWWFIYWKCWGNGTLCCKFHEGEELGKTILMILSLVCFLGIFPCVISGFVYSHRLNYL